jgi:hypothetical protein
LGLGPTPRFRACFPFLLERGEDSMDLASSYICIRLNCLKTFTKIAFFGIKLGILLHLVKETKSIFLGYWKKPNKLLLVTKTLKVVL